MQRTFGYVLVIFLIWSHLDKVHAIDVNVGDKVVLPGKDGQNFYVQLNGNGTATLLDQSWRNSSGGREQPISSKIESWKIKGENLVLTTENGDVFTYFETHVIEGVQQVSGTLDDGYDVYTFSGVMVVDQKVEMGIDSSVKGDHKILDQDGNRYVMLRSSEHYSLTYGDDGQVNGTVTDGRELAIFVTYKK